MRQQHHPLKISSSCFRETTNVSTKKNKQRHSAWPAWDENNMKWVLEGEVHTARRAFSGRRSQKQTH